MRRAAVLALAATATAAAALVLWRLRAPVVVLLAAIALAGATQPLVLALRKQGVPRVLGLTIVYLGGALTVGALFAVLLGPLLEEVRQATDALSLAYERLAARWSRGSPLQQALAAALPAPRALYAAAGRLRPEVVAQGAAHLAGPALALASQGLLAVVLSVLWTTNRDRALWLTLAALPAHRRARGRALALDLEAGVGEVVFAEGAKLCLTVAALALAFHALRLPYVALPAVAAGVVGLVPYAGALLAVGAAAMAASPAGTPSVLAAALLALAVLVAIRVYLVPGVLSPRRPHPILVMLALVALTGAAGPVGLLLAPAAAMAVQIVAEHLLPCGPAPAPPTTLEEAAARARALEARIRALPSPPRELVSLSQRLNAALSRPAPPPPALTPARGERE